MRENTNSWKKAIINGENRRLKSCAWLSGLLGTDCWSIWSRLQSFFNVQGALYYILNIWYITTYIQKWNQILYDICMCSITDIGLYIDNVITHAGQYGQNWYYIYGRTIHMLCSRVVIFVSFFFSPFYISLYG